MQLHSITGISIAWEKFLDFPFRGFCINPRLFDDGFSPSTSRFPVVQPSLCQQGVKCDGVATQLKLLNGVKWVGSKLMKITWWKNKPQTKKTVPVQLNITWVNHKIKLFWDLPY